MRIVLTVLMLLLTACQSPMLVFPGKALKGEEAETGSFAFADDYTLLTLEVNPDAPYSVILRCTVIEGELYVDAAPSRKWAGYLTSDPRVRVMLGGVIYDAIAEVVTNPAVSTRFSDKRTIYRLKPVKHRLKPIKMPRET